MLKNDRGPSGTASDLHVIPGDTKEGGGDSPESGDKERKTQQTTIQDQVKYSGWEVV